MAQFVIRRCPWCEEASLVVTVRRDSDGDLVAFMRCLNCNYEDKKILAPSSDLYEEENDE